jgi:general secretion pathway protein D
LLIAVLTTSVAFLVVVGSYSLARADGETNTLSTTNGQQNLPTVGTAPEETNEDDSADTDTTAEIIKKSAATPLQPQAPGAPLPSQAPTTPVPQAPSPMPTPRVQPQRTPATAIPTPPPQMAPPPPAAHQPPAADAANIDFEFQAAPINALLEWYSRLTNRSIISAPNLQASITFRSQTKLTKDEAIQALDSVLAINNIAAIPLGDKFLKIVQINTAKLEGVPVGRVSSPADTLGTQIIPLKNAKASEVVPLLQPYLHPYGQLLALQDSNSILITETAGNLKQMMEIITYVDQPSTLRMEMRSYVLSHAKAGDVMQRLQTIIQAAEQAGAHPSSGGSAPGGSAPGGQPALAIRRNLPSGQPGGAPGNGDESVVEGKVIMAADDRTNKIFILTRPSNFGFFDNLIAELDAKVEPDVVMKVIELNYATAEDVASLLNALITGGSAATTTHKTSSSGTTTSGARPPSIPPPPVSGGSGGLGAGDTGFLQYAEGVRLLPDPRTNSLLVMATKEDMLRIEELIKSIDTSVAQVQVEVVIAELTLNNELDVGVDVFNRLTNLASTGQKVIGSGGNNAADGNTPANLASGSLATNVLAGALAPGLTYFTTFRNLNLDTVVHALATTANSKVLSTPVIQTMDNQEADITVGESVPVPTSQTSSLVSGIGTLATAGVTSSIQYEDVAIELKVTPRINPDGYVRMDVEQKVNDIGANVNIGGTIVPTILKREAKSSLAVQDGSTIVLGGLIQATKMVTTTKVPFLGDIPFFGQIFKGQQNNRQRTELIIFIRPSVLRTDKAAVFEARRRLRLLGVSEELENHYFGNIDSDTNYPDALSTNGVKRVRPMTRMTPPPTTSPVAPVANTPTVTVQVVPSPVNPAPQPTPAPVTAPQVVGEDPVDRQSDKVKALKLQDGDMIAQ